MEKFNHYMMTLARDSRGFTQAELAEKLSIGQGTLSKYETGFADPPPEFIGDMSNVLGYLPAFFFEPGRPYGLPPFHFRRRKKLSAKALGRIIACPAQGAYGEHDQWQQLQSMQADEVRDAEIAVRAAPSSDRQ